MFRLTRTARSLSRTRTNNKKTTTAQLNISRPKSYRQFSSDQAGQGKADFNVFNFIGGGILAGGVTFIYMKNKQFNINTDAVNQAKANYEALQKLIVADSGSDDEGSDPVVLTEAPTAIDETIVEDDLAHVLEPTSKDTQNIEEIVEEVSEVVDEKAEEVEEAKVEEVVVDAFPVVEHTVEKVVEETKVEEVTVEEVAVVEIEVEEVVLEEVKVEEFKVEEAKIEEVKTEEPVIQEPTAEPATDVLNEILAEIEAENKAEAETEQTKETNDEKPDIELSPIPEEPVETKLEIDPHALPDFVPYVIVGGGAAAFAAMRSITGSDPGTKVLILTEEEYAPYQRPPLSKEFWLTGDTSKAADSLSFESWNGKMRSLYMDDEWHYAAPGELMHYEGTKVGLAINSRVSHLDTDANTAVLADGRKVKYGKCLIATGGKPKKVKELNQVDQEKITYYRTLNDFKKLEKQVREDFPGKKVVVIGGGFLGSELAVAMGDAARKSENKFTVEQIIKEEGNLGFILPDYLSKWTKGKVEECGVSVTSNARVTNATQCSETGKIRLELSNDTCVECDHVVAAVGLEIDQDFATKSGLEWDDKRGGMVVNSELQAKANVWIAGDATSFHDPKLGRRRVEHHDHAVVTGRLAGTNMSSEDAFSYYHQSMYWSDLGPEVGFEAIGLTDCKSLKTLGCFKKATSADTPKAREELADGEKIEAVETKDYGKGVVFYLNKVDRVVGVVSWNLFGKMKKWAKKRMRRLQRKRRKMRARSK